MHLLDTQHGRHACFGTLAVVYSSTIHLEDAFIQSDVNLRAETYKQGSILIHVVLSCSLHVVLSMLFSPENNMSRCHEEKFKCDTT